MQKAFEVIEPKTETLLTNNRIAVLSCKLLHISSIPLVPNMVSYMVDRYNERNDFCIIWYPSGGKGRWRTGAFQFCKITGSTLFVVGIDYRTHELIVQSMTSEITDVDECILASKKTLRYVTPYIRSSDEAHVDSRELGTIFPKHIHTWYNIANTLLCTRLLSKGYTKTVCGWALFQLWFEKEIVVMDINEPFRGFSERLSDNHIVINIVFLLVGVSMSIPSL